MQNVEFTDISKPATIGLRSYGVKGDTMNTHVNPSGCNAYRFAPEEERPEFCDCHNCVNMQLDFMEALQMEIALEIKHG